MNLFLDIETIPAQRPDVLEEIRAAEKVKLDAALSAVKPPGNYKKQETIDEWLATEAPKIASGLLASFEETVEDCYRKTGLDGAFGQVCVIGWALDADQPAAAADMDEGALLRRFFAELREIPSNEVFQTTVVGHNVANFDLRFLTQRSIVRGIRPHPVIARAAQAKPWEQEKVYDTMLQWAGVGGRISLDKLCKALSVPSPKGDLDGSKVWDYVRDGRIDEVLDYCMQDVAAVRSVWQRMTFQVQPEQHLQAA
jgi:hypothetical protein